MPYIDIKQFKDTGRSYTATVSLPGAEPQTIHFIKVKSGCMFRRFFLCPVCGHNCAKLYLDGNLFKCRVCAPDGQYKGIQNTTRGGSDYITYKMIRFARVHGIGEITFPFEYWHHERPKHKPADKWLANLAILQALENMRFQNIFMGKIWKNKTIQSVESGNNICLKDSLFDLQKWLYNFDDGVL